MRFHESVICGILATLAAASSGQAQTATQVVQFQVNAVNQIAVSGDPAPLVINAATAGSAPSSATSGATYAVTTNETNQKITASLDQAMPSGVTLEIALAAPGGAASAGSVELGTAASDVVTGISSISAASLPITYRLSAGPTTTTFAPSARTVTLTIVSGT